MQSNKLCFFLYLFHSSADETAAILLSPICKQNVFDNTPVSGPAQVSYCGLTKVIPIITSAPGTTNSIMYVQDVKKQWYKSF